MKPQAEPVFEDQIPDTIVLRGLQSARTGRGNPASEAEGARPRRTAVARRLPGRFRQLLPEARSVLAPRRDPEQSNSNDAAPVQDDSAATALHDGTTGNGTTHQSKSIFQTLKNAFGVFRTYINQPSRIPDEDMPLAHLTDGRDNMQDSLQAPRNPTAGRSSEHEPVHDIGHTIHPFPNMSTFRLAHWYHNAGASGSRESLSKLVSEVLRPKDFEVRELDKQSMEKLDRLLDTMDQRERESQGNKGDVAQGTSWDGWKEEGVKIQVPTGVKANHRPRGEDASQTFEVNGLHRRQLVDVIRSTFESQAAADFHYDPFTTHWDVPDWMPNVNPPASDNDSPDKCRIHDELYTSEAWIEEQARINQLSDIPDDLPRAIAGMMFWSDATHLTQFGSAKMWPLYLYFGNQSKLLRSKPTARASHHVAYIPSVRVYRRLAELCKN